MPDPTPQTNTTTPKQALSQSDWLSYEDFLTLSDAQKSEYLEKTRNYLDPERMKKLKRILIGDR